MMRFKPLRTAVAGADCDELGFLPQALPIVVFFSSIMSILYFLGIMQWLILKVKKGAATASGALVTLPA